MQIPHKNYAKRRLIFGVVLIIAAVIAGGSAYALRSWQQGRAETAAKNHASAPPSGWVPGPTPFSFTGATDWRTGPSDGDSLALFGKKAADGTSPCFTSVQYKPGHIDVAAKLKHIESVATSGGGVVATSLGTQPLTMKTSAGVKSYALDQFSVTSPAGENHLMGGTEYGYLQLASGYVAVMGNCETADLLPTTLPALQAIVYTSPKTEK